MFKAGLWYLPAKARYSYKNVTKYFHSLRIFNLLKRCILLAKNIWQVHLFIIKSPYKCIHFNDQKKGWILKQKLTNSDKDHIHLYIHISTNQVKHSGSFNEIQFKITISSCHACLHRHPNMLWIIIQLYDDFMQYEHNEPTIYL